MVRLRGSRAVPGREEPNLCGAAPDQTTAQNRDRRLQLDRIQERLRISFPLCAGMPVRIREAISGERRRSKVGTLTSHESAMDSLKHLWMCDNRHTNVSSEGIFS